MSFGNPRFGPTDFAPVTAARSAETIPRPSLSYWQDAWRRLKENRRAFISLYIVIAMGLFTVPGPWLWARGPGGAGRGSDQPTADATRGGHNR